ncbi:hypothetical protein CHLRE_15g635250v5 [Chlamydomonas reinhardtii]|uniref:Uncharacterized protein n=1 Tax=Chlamydomonas reinhardtii TaxID=3055 RepID=A0A2K3CWD3_CHLRE|nr:uncharacterized protein CHLRE_15g635250v5 [Chlamydomonas reinhardtii]PNW72594.1 hypothetical protein CHLRE_15g635250v5 [Chlamydomonas reinhardtii]
MPSRALTSAAAAGNLAACERLLALGHKHTGYSYAARAAAQEGHIAVLQLLLGAAASVGATRQACLDAATRGACAGGRLSLLHWLQANHPTTVSALACANEAAAAGHAELLESLLPLLHASWADAAGRQADSGKNKLRLLGFITRGCPFEVLRRHFDSLWPWGPAPVPVPVPAGAGAVAGGGADLAAVAAAVAGAGGAGDAAAAAAGEPPRNSDLAPLFTAAAGSATPCWAAKLDFLCGAFPPGTAARLLRANRFNFGDVARAPDYVARLRRLWHLVDSQPQAAGQAAAAAGAAARRDLKWCITKAMVLTAVRYGHADALRYLLDECGVPLDTHDTFIMYMNFAEDVGSSGRLGATATGAAGANGHLAVLQLLRNEGVAFKAKDLVRQGCWHRAAAAVRMTWLMEVVVDAPGDGDGWSAVFVAAARGGAGLPLLRALRARGAAVDLDAVACGGSLEALEWAVEELAAERGEAALQVPVSPRYVRTIRIAGDNSTLDWLRGRGLLPPLLVRVRELQRDGGKGVGDADA